MVDDVSRLLLPLLLSCACMTYRSDATAECEDQGHTTLIDPSTGNCIILFETARAWGSARLWCQVAAGADLLTIPGPVTNFHAELLSEGERVWVGASDLDEEGTWVWVDGSDVAYQSWDPGEPNNSGQTGDEDCMELNYGSRGAWNDDACARAKPFLCARSALLPDR